MKLKFYWTRWSTPISNPNSIKYWWNTTCVRIYSECIPKWSIFCLDAWSWFVPLSNEAFSEWLVNEVVIAYTHYHHDHTQWIFLSPFLFIKDIKLRLIWPIDKWIWPKEMMEHLMTPPFFPVHLKEVESHIEYEWFEFPPTTVIAIHPIWWYSTLNKRDYENYIKGWKQIPINNSNYPIKECLILTMHKSHHPEQTVSYRIEEKTTWKKFVFLTDHENEYWVSQALANHLDQIDFLAIDSQYTKEKYMTHTAWFWHWTPDYCANVAESIWVPKMWLIHHDPWSTDDMVEQIVQTAKDSLKNKDSVEIFWIKDYMEIEV